MVLVQLGVDLEQPRARQLLQVCLEQRLLLRARLAERAVIYLETRLEDCGRFDGCPNR